MKTYFQKHTFLIVLFALLSIAVKAQDVISEVALFKVETMPDGTQILSSAEYVLPGDVVEYQLFYSNNGNKAVSDLQPILPIPTSFAFNPDHVGENKFPVQLSINGEQYSEYPLLEKIKGVDGQPSRPVDDKKYRFLKWKINQLDAGKTLVLKARMNVL